jgi:capsular polysaccharide biosynthesis protein
MKLSERIIIGMRKIVWVMMLLAILITILGGAIACKSSSPSTTYESTIRAYADPATEITLLGLSENNVAKYTQYGNSEFKAAVTQEILDETATQLGSQLGAYESKEFLSIEEQEGYTIVHY